MKHGVAVTITQTWYIEVEAECEEEAKAKAAKVVSEEHILSHETKVKECKIKGYYLGKEYNCGALESRLRWIQSTQHYLL